MKEHHDHSSRRELPPLCPGQHVTVLNKDRGTWHPAIVMQKCNEPRSYIVQTPNGSKIRRCRSHLRELYTPQMEKSIKKVCFAEPQVKEETRKSDSEPAGTPSTKPCETHTNREEAKNLEPVRTRYARAITKPAHYNDYV